jgi:transposase
VDFTRVVVLDETGCNAQLTPEYGWAIRGERLVDRRPAARGKNLSVVGAVRVDRVLCHQEFEGALNAERWMEFVSKTLIPVMYPGDILLLDNLQIHKNIEALELIEAAGVEVKFLPAYSPDFSPIELCWSFLKHHVRRLRERSIPALRRAVWRSLLRVTGKHLRAWFAKCGFCVQLN